MLVVPPPPPRTPAACGEGGGGCGVWCFTGLTPCAGLCRPSRALFHGLIYWYRSSKFTLYNWQTRRNSSSNDTRLWCSIWFLIYRTTSSTWLLLILNAPYPSCHPKRENLLPCSFIHLELHDFTNLTVSDNDIDFDWTYKIWTWLVVPPTAIALQPLLFSVSAIYACISPRWFNGNRSARPLVANTRCMYILDNDCDILFNVCFQHGPVRAWVLLHILSPVRATYHRIGREPYPMVCRPYRAKDMQ